MIKRGIVNTSIIKNKTMLKQKRKNSTFFKLRNIAIGLAVLGLAGSAVVAHADQYDDQINALQQQNSSTQSQVDGCLLYTSRCV